MRRALAVLVLAGCSRAAPSSAALTAGDVSAPVAELAAAPAPPVTWSAPTTGEAFALEVDAARATWCDADGRHELDLATGRVSRSPRPCPKPAEANPSCGDLGVDVDVAAPLGTPSDVVFAGGWGFHPRGRVHDCAASGASIAVVTGESVELLDLMTGGTRIVSPEGAWRVALGGGSVAWARGRAVHATR